MKTGFKDPIPEDKGEKKVNNEKLWNFDAPPYDERTSSFVNAGCDHGVGHRQPVGHEGNAKQRVACMPFGRPSTLKVDKD